MKKKFGKYFYYYCTFGKTKGDAERKARGIEREHGEVKVKTMLHPTVSGWEVYFRYIGES